MSNNTIEKKRVVINKPSEKECNICHGRFSLYSFSSHIKHVHQLTSDDYASKYGEFRKPTRPPTNRNIKHLICQLCNNSFPSVGMFTHLRDTHAVTVDTYVNQYGEYRPSKLRQIEYVERLKVIDANDKQICVICHSEFASGNLLGYHVKNIHNLTKKDYVLNYIFKGVRPLCECGCQRKVKILSYPPYKVDFISGHNSIGEGNVMFGKHFSVESKKKMSLKAIDRINSGIKKTIDTEPELKFKSILEFYNVTFIHPHSVDLGNRVISVDFYLPEKDLLVEIDGEYWHPEKIEDLNFHILPNVISDKQREVVENMVHIRSLDLKIFDQFKTKEQVLDFIANFSNSNCMGELRYKQKIINKEYFTTCLQNKGKPYVKSYIWLLLKFLFFD